MRTNSTIRRLAAETRLSVDDLVYPMFVRPGRGGKEPVESMENCFRLTPDLAAKEAAEIHSLGIPAVLLFGTKEKKDHAASTAPAADSAVCRTIDKIKSKTPNLLVITDVCLCAYTDHGHCGLIKDGKIDNDATLPILAKMAVAHANAGADIVAPSDMMDGRVGAIRQALDEKNLAETAIMSYSAKFASAFYGPFRDAADCCPSFGDRRTYQADPACGRGALRQMQADIEQGADIVMVKPALAYLDIISKARRRFDVPVAAYNVSGEYMMIHAAAKAGLLDLRQAMTETLLSIKRAGADIIISYFAPAVAESLKK